jgi:hypothetical protein
MQNIFALHRLALSCPSGHGIIKMKGQEIGQDKQNNVSKIMPKVGLRMYPCLGNIHIHSTCSDGSSTIPEIARDAAKAGLQFIIITDHSTLEGSIHEGYHDDVLVLCGSEFNKEKNHYLALGINSLVDDNDQDPQQVIDAVAAQNGLGFIAHPYEKGSPLVLSGRTYPWDHWEATNFHGIEIWNWCSQWRDGVSNIFRGLLYAYIHRTGPITGPCPQALAQYDRLTQTRKLTAIAGTDAHNWPVRYGPIRRDIFPYHYLFRTACNILQLTEPLSRDTHTAKAQIYHALRHGRSYIVNRQAGDPEGFQFTAISADREYHIGEDVPLTDMTILQITCPHRYRGTLRIRIIHNGSLLHEINRCNVSIRASKPGTYRLEVYHGKKPWIFTNPLYIGDGYIAKE